VLGNAPAPNIVETLRQSKLHLEVLRLSSGIELNTMLLQVEIIADDDRRRHHENEAATSISQRIS
jgi:hypothetical protein